MQDGNRQSCCGHVRSCSFCLAIGASSTYRPHVYIGRSFGKPFFSSNTFHTKSHAHSSTLEIENIYTTYPHLNFIKGSWVGQNHYKTFNIKHRL